jgi:hypothetical protein
MIVVMITGVDDTYAKGTFDGPSRPTSLGKAVTFLRTFDHEGSNWEAEELLGVTSWDVTDEVRKLYEEYPTSVARQLKLDV